jgi:hypothetical protein
MVRRITLYAVALLSGLSLSGEALAADAPIRFWSCEWHQCRAPSAAVQKQAVQSQTEGRSLFSTPKRPPVRMLGGAIAAGAPGVEGAFGAESGR